MPPRDRIELRMNTVQVEEESSSSDDESSVSNKTPTRSHLPSLAESGDSQYSPDLRIEEIFKVRGIGGGSVLSSPPLTQKSV